MTMRKTMRVLLVALPWIFAPVHAAQRLPVETFARQFTYDTMEISPGGTRIAVSYLRQGTEMLAVVDLQNDQAVVLSSVKNPDRILDVTWKSDTRLIYRVFAHGRDDSRFPVYYAIDADGTRRVPLNFNWQRNYHIPAEMLIDLAWEDPHSALFASNAADDERLAVYRTDLEKFTPPAMAHGASSDPEWPTKRKVLFKAPGRWCQYLTDNAGVVRTCLTDEEANTRRLLYREADGSEWVEVAHVAFGDQLEPVGFTPDNKRFYVIADIGRSTRALFLFDPARKALGEKIFEADGVDVRSGVTGGDGRGLIAVTYDQKGKGIYYLDSDIAAIHAELNKAFPRQQVQLRSFSRDNRKIIVWVGSPSTPGAYHLYDRDHSSIRELTDIAPWIDPEKMAVTRAIEFDARDGMHLHGYLTLPRDASPKGLPLILNVHGGPHGVRDTADFDRETQLFANRGYAVLQVNFRGSGGYGREFFSAGKREWGRKMQTDLEDGVKWLADRGTIDPARVGIFGGSYGGYATMMALITAPDMFKCGVTYAGVSNLVRMLNAGKVWVRNGTWGRTISKDERMWWESVIGDRHDEAALREISPLFNVDRIKAPVFIAHGGEDLTVPAVEATDLERAMRRAGKPVEMMIAPNEGHGFFDEKTRKLFYERMDAFFAKYLPAG